MRLLFALLFGTTLLLAAPIPKEKPKVKDEEAILGKWEYDKFDAGGGTVPPEDNLKGMVFEFKKDGKLTMSPAVKQKQPAEDAKYKLDESLKVKQIDIINPMPRGTIKAVYELDGDILKLCTPDVSTKDRPMEVKADKDINVVVVTFKRVVEEKKDK